MNLDYNCYIKVQEMSTKTVLMWLKLLAVVEFVSMGEFYGLFMDFITESLPVLPWVTVVCMLMRRLQVKSSSTPRKQWKRWLTNKLFGSYFVIWTWTRDAAWNSEISWIIREIKGFVKLGTSASENWACKWQCRLSNYARPFDRSLCTICCYSLRDR